MGRSDGFKGSSSESRQQSNRSKGRNDERYGKAGNEQWYEENARDGFWETGVLLTLL